MLACILSLTLSLFLCHSDPQRRQKRHFPEVFHHFIWILKSKGDVRRVHMHSVHDSIKSLSLFQTHTETTSAYSKYLNILDSSEHLLKGRYMIKHHADAQVSSICTCVFIKDTLWRCPEEYLWSSCGKGISRGWRESLACLNWRAQPERKTHKVSSNMSQSLLIKQHIYRQYQSHVFHRYLFILFFLYCNI